MAKRFGQDERVTVRISEDEIKIKGARSYSAIVVALADIILRLQDKGYDIDTTMSFIMAVTKQYGRQQE